MLSKIFQKWCSHQFAIEDLTIINPESEGNDRVIWTCDKCGKKFFAHCGLDISPKYGMVIRRRTIK